ncbi:HypC/HybG/HupF family hydrogenase formation chaperone [Methylococcus sp. EFPC2]|uniref:HypC/HybG/HupF family hydrogenase formation chaperone n=1 Tax=Methylococcus sp. EFPC2 TaxID=2812648 RepID=UPI001966D7B6|nr:HypC/HybG/HupF family hydrogenase formation chaperone [Methylococcus sp. EFPC2]QSA97329.1 HypC/HybG/HupF family hydrogenase formation chaperone [Methylococcus sp. EFPC2]
MCLGIPMQVLAVDGRYARCAGRDGEKLVDLGLVGEVIPGQWLMTFMDTARSLLNEEEAALSNAALDALAAVLAGADDVSDYFADLTGREPQLPDFLKTRP